MLPHTLTAPQPADATRRPHRRRHRHLPLRPLRRLPARRPAARRRRTCRSPSPPPAMPNSRQRLEQIVASARPRPLRRPPRRRRPVCRQPAALPARASAAPGSTRSPRRSPSPAAIPNATRTTAPPSSAARSPIPSRPAPPPASPSANGPPPRHAAAAELRTLRQVAGRLQAVVRQRTRLINQFHHLLALTFPELALLVKDIATGWVLELVHRYPTAALLAAASARRPRRHPLSARQARSSRCSTTPAPPSPRSTAPPPRNSSATRSANSATPAHGRNAWKTCWSTPIAPCPTPNHLDTIPGIGDVTAAVLTAFILDIDRFDTPGQARRLLRRPAHRGRPAASIATASRAARRRYVMSRRGNDLVRRYLWMAALSAPSATTRPCAPCTRASSPSIPSTRPSPSATPCASSCTWPSPSGRPDKPFDPEHYPWDAPAHVDGRADGVTRDQVQRRPGRGPQAGTSRQRQWSPRPVPTAVADAGAELGEDAFVDFAHLKRQLPMARVLDHLGLTARLRGSGPQRRCACPIHRGDGRGRTFSVNLDDNVFQCFDASCGKQGRRDRPVGRVAPA